MKDKPFLDLEVVRAIVLAQFVVLLAAVRLPRYRLLTDKRLTVALLLLPAAISAFGFCVVNDPFPPISRSEGWPGTLLLVRGFIVRFLPVLCLTVATAYVVLWIGWVCWRRLSATYQVLRYPIGDRARLRKPLDYSSTQGAVKYRDWE
ncbi:MAG: hypothetical protein COZ56_07990 [Armatimonadetes bacterium CG_4_8_14_3_um_filter_58_9]|nr:MAG: hypothetical protein COZ56_07990 [Armatimonadetes bacterium CG_4_8_14_3_um_filter_58_9]PJB74762.1 MAG: hypothetical protein CO095_04430 [Armatimonadetes bacterium CG_4_9_14_3_um_filter_58_7]